MARNEQMTPEQEITIRFRNDLSKVFDLQKRIKTCVDSELNHAMIMIKRRIDELTHEFFKNNFPELPTNPDREKA